MPVTKIKIRFKQVYVRDNADMWGEATWLLTAKVDGKTVNESFPTPAALRKAQRQVAEFQRWQQLGQQLLTINQKICALRPVEEERGGWTPQEKKRLLRSIKRLRGK